MRERRDGAHHRMLAHADAEIGLQRPDRDHHCAGYAELLLDALKQGGMLAHERARLGDARRDARRSELLEGLLEHALPLVELDHARIGREPGKGGLDHLRRNFLRLRLARELRKEGVEVAAALRGARGRRAERRESERQTGERKSCCREPSCHRRHLRKVRLELTTPSVPGIVRRYRPFPPQARCDVNGVVRITEPAYIVGVSLKLGKLLPDSIRPETDKAEA